tara:strand:- start:2609 stop:3397 length:789 start_codon:yes stop_codon:yes gene_type:complete
MDYNEKVSNLNRQIEDLNLRSRLEQQEKVKEAQQKVESLKAGEPVRELESTAQTTFGVVAGKGKPIKALGKIAEATPKAVVEGIDAFSDFMDPPDSTLRMLRSSYPTSTLQDLSESLKGDVAVGKTIAERSAKYGKLGVAGTVASLGQGLYDAYEDIDAGKIVGKDADERRANVLNMVSGTLEGIGTALDVTGVAAPVGVAFNILGGLTGLAGGVESIIGEAKEPKQAEQELKTQEQTKAPQQKLQAFQDIGSTGQIVKQAK